MSVKRAYALQDIWVDEQSLTANLGLSPILQVHNIYNAVKDRKEFARIFLKFNLSALTGSINSGDLPSPITDTSVSAYMYMFDAKHGDEIATSFNLDVHPLTQEWDEGNGLDIEALSETGYANALSAQSTIAWTTTGGTFTIDASSGTQHFDHGGENLKVNITDLFKDWLAGNTGNFGVAVKMASTQEDKITASLSAQSHNFKKFYGRTTNTTMAPYIQLEWDGAIKDDRAEISFNSTGSLYFYNIVNGQLQDLNGTGPFPGNVTLSGNTVGITTNLTASREEKGIYKASVGTLALTANTYTAFVDNWFVSASPTANYAFTFTTSNPASGFNNYTSSEYRITMKNLRKQYEKGSQARIRIHVRDDSLGYTALTAASTAITNFIITDGTVEIRDSFDRVEVGAYNISRDVNGNFFSIDTDNLYIGEKYNPVLKLNVRGETIYIRDTDRYEFSII